MSLTLNYDQDNARVEIVVDGLQTAGAAIASVQRSVDGVNWTGVRGAVDFAVEDDDPILFFDYEYTPGPGVTNQYRVVGQDAVEFIGVGAADSDSASGSGAGITLSPTIHGSTSEGDLLLLHLQWSRRSGLFNPAPSGWTQLARDPFGTGNGMGAIYAKIAGPGESSPTINIPGSAAGDNYVVGIAQVATFRNVFLSPLAVNSIPSADQTAATNNIDFPGVTVSQNNVLVVIFGGSSAAWTSVATVSGFTDIDDPTANLSPRDASLCWQYQVQGDATDVSAGVFVVTGGSHTEKNGHTAVFQYDAANAPTSVLFSGSVDTPLDVAWLKNPLRPGRNMVVKLGAHRNIGHVARSGLFDVKGRAEPIEITETRRSPAWEQTIVADTFDDYDAILALLATGETLLLHVPGRDPNGGCKQITRPGGYVHIGNVFETHSPNATLPVGFTANMQQVAAPRAELGFIEPPESSL